jgi:hypothetical protein
MDTINDLYVIEVNLGLLKGEFGLCGWLHESSARHTATLAIVTTFSLCAILTLDTTSPASDGTAPDYVKAVIVNGNLDVLLLPSIYLEAPISWSRVLEEALADCPRLNTLGTLEAISITPALSILAATAAD